MPANNERNPAKSTDTPPAVPAVLLKLAGVRKIFRMGEVEVPVLRGLDLEIRRGELTVILGASGSGKSTLLNLIGGLDRPTEGQVLFGAEDLARFDDQQLTRYRREQVGFVFQFYNLVASLTARENVEVATEVASDPIDPAEILGKVGLGDRLDHFPAQMSGGQQQRVAIARAVAKRPTLLLCDEPTGALDHETGVQVLELLGVLNRDLGTTIVMVTHAPPIAAMAHRVIRIESGRIKAVEVNPQPRAARELAW